MTKTATVRFYRTEGVPENQSWRWQAHDDSNGELVGASSEGYGDLTDAKHNFRCLTGCAWVHPTVLAEFTNGEILEMEERLARASGRYAYRVIVEPDPRPAS